MASTALVTIWEARDELASSVARASSNSALAKMMPSWLFSRWKSAPRSVGWSICSGSVCKCGYGIWLRIVLADLSVRLDGRNLARSGIRLPPQRIDEDADRPPGCPNVFDFAARDPVIDGPTTYADQVAGFHDRDRFPVHYHLWRSHLPTVPEVLNGLACEAGSKSGIGTALRCH